LAQDHKPDNASEEQSADRNPPEPEQSHAMEQVQEEAAEERENDRGYQ
jgi:hypothetical protein